MAVFDAIVSEQYQLLSEGKFTSALTNILKQIGRSQNEQTDTGKDASGELFLYINGLKILLYQTSHLSSPHYLRNSYRACLPEVETDEYPSFSKNGRFQRIPWCAVSA